MPDIWNDHRGSGCDWIGCRAVCQRGLPISLSHLCGIPIAVEGLGDVPLLSIPVRHGHADPVCLGEERAGHSDLVHQRMVGVDVQIPVCVGLFSEHQCDQRTISVTVNHGVQKWECSFHLCLNGELDGGFGRVQVVVEQPNLFLGQGCEGVIHVPLPKRWLDCAGSEGPLLGILHHQVGHCGS